MSNNILKKTLKAKHEEFINTLYHQETKDLIKTKTYFAGGAIRDLLKNREPKDYDLFFVDTESNNKFKELAKKEFSLMETVIGNFNCKVGTSVQVVTLVSGSPDKVVSKFDFTINTGYYVPQMDTLVKPTVIISNTLEVLPNVMSPLQALLRVSKFESMGYEVPQEVLIKLGVAISYLSPINTPERLLEELKGVSTSIVLDNREE